MTAAPRRVAIQGAAASWSDLALDRLPRDAGAPAPERLYLDSFTAAVTAVAESRADQALLPIENTIAGSLNEVYALLAAHPVTIVAEQELAVDHCLAACAGADLGGLRRVFSHPVALQQCGRFLAGLAGCTAEARADTARAAEAVAAAGDPTHAAICSEVCARRLGLPVLARHIADVPGNVTRFVLIGRTPPVPDHRRPGRTSLTMTVANRQGALARCLGAFARHDLNLSKLESRRRSGVAGEYLFYLDVDAWVDEAAMAAALAEVKADVIDFRLLGSYPRGDADATA